MKKLLAMFLAVVMIACCFAGCGAKGGNEGDAEYKVAMITDFSDITDQSFNQITYEACKAFCDKNGVEFKYFKPAGDTTADRVGMVEKAADEGFNVIVMPGFSFGGTIFEVSEDYSDIKFIGVDVSAGDILEAGVPAAGEEYDWTPENWTVTDYYYEENVYCAIYQEHLAGYMAGYAAVKMGYTELGFLGGMAVPAVNRYGYGFVQGVEAAAVELGVNPTIKFAYGNTFAPDPDIKAAMDTWYDNGTEIIFPCGGGIYSSVADAAAAKGGKIIGVDVDQSGIIDSTYGAGLTVTSAMKGLYNTTYNTLEDVVLNGNWANYAGKIESLGLVSGDIEGNYVGIPSDTTQWTDGFTVEDYKAMVADMFSGKIVVSGDITGIPATTNTTVVDLGSVK